MLHGAFILTQTTLLKLYTAIGSLLLHPMGKFPHATYTPETIAIFVLTWNSTYSSASRQC